MRRRHRSSNVGACDVKEAIPGHRGTRRRHQGPRPCVTTAQRQHVHNGIHWRGSIVADEPQARRLHCEREGALVSDYGVHGRRQGR